MLGAVSELVASVALALGRGVVTSTLSIAVVHGGAAGCDNGACCAVRLVTLKFLSVFDVVGEELVGGREIIVRHEVTSLRDSKVLKVVASAPIPTIDKLGIRCGKVLHPVDLA